MITASGVKPIGQWQWLCKAFWLYGAGEPATGESFFLQFSHVDAQCYQWLLDEFFNAYLERIVVELPKNTCKYTPTDGMIVVSAQAKAEKLKLSVGSQ
ncbi:MAG: hypothetical protein WCA35_27785 [Kovacikia sp.]